MTIYNDFFKCYNVSVFWVSSLCSSCSREKLPFLFVGFPIFPTMTGTTGKEERKGRTYAADRYGARHVNVYTEMQKKKERKANEKSYRSYPVGSYGLHLLYRMRKQRRQ